MNPYQADVHAFMAAMDQPTPTAPTLTSYPFAMRARIILEEALEFAEAAGLHVAAVASDGSLYLTAAGDACQSRDDIGLTEPDQKTDWPEMIDALVDLLYVTFGAAVSMGVDLDPFWRIVHQANMQKVDGPIREDGKRLKPPGWTAPDIAGMLAQVQAAIAETSENLTTAQPDEVTASLRLRPYQHDQVAEVVADYIARTPVTPMEIVGAGARSGFVSALKVAEAELAAARARIQELEADVRDYQRTIRGYVDGLGRPNR